MATTVLTVGFVTPIAGRLFGMVVAIPSSLYATTCRIFVVLALLLHLAAGIYSEAFGEGSI